MSGMALSLWSVMLCTGSHAWPHASAALVTFQLGVHVPRLQDAADGTAGMGKRHGPA